MPTYISALAVIRREAGGARWMWLTVGYMFALVFIAAFIVYRVTSVITG